MSGMRDSRVNDAVAPIAAWRERAERAEVHAGHMEAERDEQRARANSLERVQDELLDALRERDEAEQDLADLRAHHDALHEQRDRALAALRVAREGLAKYEPDPQHYTVTVCDVLAELEAEGPNHAGWDAVYDGMESEVGDG